jgi:hypothetical protein
MDKAEKLDNTKPVCYFMETMNSFLVLVLVIIT